MKTVLVRFWSGIAAGTAAACPEKMVPREKPPTVSRRTKREYQALFFGLEA